MTFTKITAVKIGLIIGLIVYLTACEIPTKTQEQNYDLFKGLEQVEGAEKVKVTINQGSAVGRDAYFEFEIENIDSELLEPGVYDGWCIDWTKHIAQQGAVHENLEMYSTFGKEEWKPLNYFLNIKDELKQKDPELSFAEFQAVIWTVQEGPDFDVNKLSDNELPPRLLKDGVPIFSREKVNAIVDQIHANAPSFEYSSETKYALFLKTGEDEQDVMVPADPPEDGDDENMVIEIEDLGNIKGFGLNEALAINNSGEITGNSAPRPREEDGYIFLWNEQDGMEAIPQYPDDGMFPFYRSVDINNETQIVGTVWMQDGERLSLLWDPTVGLKSLGNFEVKGLNNNETLIFAGDFEGDEPDGFTVDAAGNKQYLQKVSDYYGSVDNNDVSTPVDINDNGVVLGTGEHPELGEVSVLWKNGNIIHVFDDFEGEMVAINNQGQVAGHINGYGVLWDEQNGYTYFETVDNYHIIVTDINNHGQIVGFLSDTPNPYAGDIAFYWDKTRGLILLEPLGEFTIGEANSINDMGVIAGQSSNEAGRYMAVRWTITFE